MKRAVTDLCEVCGTAAPVFGVGFPAHPQNTPPGLPEFLRGACIWVCGAPDCETRAQKRAALAAANANLRLKGYWRHLVFKSDNKSNT